MRKQQARVVYLEYLQITKQINTHITEKFL